MIPDTLDGVLWLVRLALRSTWCTVNAGHGFADPQYRPPVVPYVSVVGPLSVEVEPERDGTEVEDALVLLPGYVLGTARTTENAAGGGVIALTFDGDAHADVTVPNAIDFSTDGAARAACAAIEAAIRAATFLDPDDAPITDPDWLAELGRITVRWDPSGRRVAIASGHHGDVDVLSTSSVEVRVADSTLAGVVGLDPAERVQPGRFVRRRRGATRGFALDLRVDLWASTQRDLADLLDRFNRLIPTRGTLAVRPGLLAADVEAGDTTLRLLSAGEPTQSTSLLHLEAGDGVSSRVGPELTLSGGTTDPQGLVLDGTDTASVTLHAAPLVPDPRRAAHPWPGGLALSLDFTIDAGLNGAFQLVRVEHAGQPVLQITGITGGGGPNRRVDLVATATFSGGTATTTRRVPRAVADAGLALHVVVSAGAVHLQLDGDTQDLSDGAVTPAPPSLGSGTIIGGDDVSFVLGNPAGNPDPVLFSTVHLHAAPVWALDARFRGAVLPPARLLPGDPIALSGCTGGVPAADAELRRVVSVSGDEITLDRPLERAWSRAATVVHGHRWFLHQRQAKRKDDLMNRLYRYCLTYRVSAVLEPPVAAHSGALVLEPIVDVAPRGAAPPSIGAPGTRPSEPVPTL